MADAQELEALRTHVLACVSSRLSYKTIQAAALESATEYRQAVEALLEWAAGLKQDNPDRDPFTIAEQEQVMKDIAEELSIDWESSPEFATYRKVFASQKFGDPNASAHLN